MDEYKVFARRTLTIGTDPEFVLKNIKKNIVVAAKGFDFFNKTQPDDKIGRDGAARPVEIRPNATYINKLDYMIQDINNIIKNISIFCNKNNLIILCGAKTDNVSIGGHIHFGGRDIKGGKYYHSGRNDRVYNNTQKLVYALDFYLTPMMNLFIPIEEVVKRRISGYGESHDFREQHWGIEYRTPYSFLASPIMTNGFYALSCLIAHHYNHLELNGVKQNLLRDYNRYIHSNGNGLETTNGKIYNIVKPTILKMMSRYSPNPKYNPYILSLFSLIEQHKTNISKDVLANYGLKKQESQPIVSMSAYSPSLNIIVKKIHNTFKGKKFDMHLRPYYKNGKRYLFYDIRFEPPSPLKDIKVYKHLSLSGIFNLEIGLSKSLIDAIVSSRRHRSWFLKYIKKTLKL